jgi:hypothetical protein
MRDLVQEWGAAQDTFEQAPPPGSEWAQTNTPSQQAASAGPLVCIICLRQVHILFLQVHNSVFLTAQVPNWNNRNALLSHIELWAVSATAGKERHDYAAMDKGHQYA